MAAPDSNAKRRSAAHGTRKSQAAIKQLGLRIKALREDIELTQAQAAEKASLDDKHWSDMERGVTNPTVATLVAVAASLEVELYELFCDEE